MESLKLTLAAHVKLSVVDLYRPTTFEGTKGVEILWKTIRENTRICIVFCDFRVPLVVHFADRGQHKKQNEGVFLLLFWDGVREGFGALFR